MAQYQADVRRFVDFMFRMSPFDKLRLAINVHRVGVVSTDSGADDPKGFGGSGTVARTYFDATFCGDSSIRSLLVVNEDTALAVANAQVPTWNVALAIINSTLDGGSGGEMETFSCTPGFEKVAHHELGHTAFNLVDEDAYLQGCKSETDQDNYQGSKPAEANVTVKNDPAKLSGVILWR